MASVNEIQHVCAVPALPDRLLNGVGKQCARSMLSLQLFTQSVGIVIFRSWQLCEVDEWFFFQLESVLSVPFSALT